MYAPRSSSSCPASTRSLCRVTLGIVALLVVVGTMTVLLRPPSSLLFRDYDHGFIDKGLEALSRPGATPTPTGHNSNGTAIFIALFTNVDASDVRRLLRETWVSQDDVDENVMLVYWRFFIPRPLSETKAASLAAENEIFGDVVLLDLPDDPVMEANQLLLKEAMAVQWACAHLPDIDMIFKADDDVFVHMPRLADTLRPLILDNHRRQGKELYVGSIVYGGQAFERKPAENYQNYWASEEDLPLCHTSSYMQGGFFGLTRGLACAAVERMMHGDRCTIVLNGLEDTLWGVMVELMRLDWADRRPVELVSFPTWAMHLQFNQPWPGEIHVLHKLRGNSTLRRLHDHLIRQGHNDSSIGPCGDLPSLVGANSTRVTLHQAALADALAPYVVLPGELARNGTWTGAGHLDKHNLSDATPPAPSYYKLCYTRIPATINDGIIFPFHSPVPHSYRTLPPSCYYNASHPLYGNLNRFFIDAFLNHTNVGLLYRTNTNQALIIDAATATTTTPPHSTTEAPKIHTSKPLAPPELEYRCRS